MQDEKKHIVAVATNEIGVLNILNVIRMHNYHRVCLIIYVRSNIMLELAEKCKAFDFIDELQILKPVNRGSALRLFFAMLLPAQFFRLQNTKNNYYGANQKNFIIIVQNMMNAFILSRVFPKAEIQLVDEGLSTYTGRVTEKRYRSRIFKILYAFFGKRDYNELIDKLYLSDLSMIQTQFHNLIGEIKVHRTVLESLLCDQEYKYVLHQHATVYLGVPMFGLIDLCADADIDRPAFLENAESVLKILFNNIDGTIYYKQHPLEQTVHFDKFQPGKVNYIRNSWEKLVYNSIDDNTVIFNFFSTSVLFPKLVLNKEPYVIFLHRMLNNDLLNAEQVFQNFKNSYEDKSRVCAPRTESELVEIIQLVNERKQQHAKRTN